MQYIYILTILLPVLCGLWMRLQKSHRGKRTETVAFICVAITSALTIFLTANCSGLEMIGSTQTISVSLGFRLDGFGKLFAAMVSVLWPIALLYAFVYMKHDENRYSYYSFYVMTYGVVLGIAYAANAITMYIFYEILTFITLPLILHTQTKESRKAGRTYLYYSLSGSSLALAGIIILAVRHGSVDFAVGSRITALSDLTQLAYLLIFFGFGVKAAVFPLSRWLPTASAAPTPTTALLHAVAVVKAGAFAIIRFTYYVFTPEMLRGSWAQTVAILAAALTIVYGSAMAVREQHFKRRFAYSTVANLSYILFGALLCTRAGLTASMLHFLMHSVTKIGIFFCCGAIIETSGAQYLYQLNGLGKKMPLIFAFFTISGCSLVGIPPFGGFISKYYLIESALAEHTVTSYIGVGALILSAVLTAYYVFSVSVRAYSGIPTDECRALYEKAEKPGKGFTAICGTFAAVALLAGVFAEPVLRLVMTLIGGDLG